VASRTSKGPRKVEIDDFNYISIRPRIRHSITGSDWAAIEPFYDDALGRLMGMGIVERPDGELRSRFGAPIPARRVPTRYKNANTPGLEAFGLTVYVAKAIGDGIIALIINDVWKKAITPALVKWRKRGAKSHVGRAGFLIAVWFGVEGVSINVESDTTDGTVLKPLVERGIAQAYEWLKEHGVTHTSITYAIRQGEISSIPVLKDERSSQKEKH
jgi:hypothetical protein